VKTEGNLIFVQALFRGGDAMKHLIHILVSIVSIVTVCTLYPGKSICQEKTSLWVADGAICPEVVDRECVSANTRFSAGVGTLFCFTRINGAEGATEVFHVWYFGDTERARVRLGVNSSNWRTHSSKIILPHEIGTWKVDVLDSEGKLLQAIDFDIVP